jgi:acetyl-CoA carboxylase carboxyl transferase subunit beta
VNWLTNFVRPKLRALVKRADVPDKLWHKCPKCDQIIFHRDLERNLHVCQHCGHHMRMTVEARLRLFFDDGIFERAKLPNVPTDPLKFRDQRKYTDRLRDAQRSSGEDDAIVVASGKMDGRTIVVAVFNFSFMGGSMGRAVGEGVLLAAQLAVEKNAPMIAVPASGGARMQEGVLSLMQMPRTVIAVQQVKNAGLPYIVLLTDPTTGGVTASFAMLGDIQIAEPDAMIGFAGQRIIEQTVRETLPEGFQRAEYLLEHGMIDMVVPRGELRQTLCNIFDLLCRPMPKGSSGALSIPDRPDSAQHP